MILDETQTKSLLTASGVYDGRLLTQQFAYKYYESNISPLGNIVGFVSPTKIGPVGMEEAFILAGEIQNLNAFGTCCFQRLYATQIGSLLSIMIGKDFYVDENSILCEDKQVCITLTNKVKDAGVFHMVFPIKVCVDFESVISNIDLGERFAEFQKECIASFDYLINNIFVGSCRDNF